MGFFKQLGLYTYSDKGRVFPMTNQAASVLDVLIFEIERLGIVCELNCNISKINLASEGFVATSDHGKEFRAKKIILACGGKSYPAFGADGSGYKLARSFRHTLIKPVPATVPFVVKDSLCHNLQGQKIFAAVTSFVQKRQIRKTAGELLFTKYGLSGTAILDASDEISVAINRNGIQDVSVSIDLIPFLSEVDLIKVLAARIGQGLPTEHLFAGILPRKFSFAFSSVLKTGNPKLIAQTLKHKRFAVNGTRGWNEAEFTAGGIDTNEIDHETLESKLVNNLYLAGEILNVQGRRGGYNLAWAWASGLVAGFSSR